MVLELFGCQLCSVNRSVTLLEYCIILVIISYEWMETFSKTSVYFCAFWFPSILTKLALPLIENAPLKFKREKKQNISFSSFYLSPLTPSHVHFLFPYSDRGKIFLSTSLSLSLSLSLLINMLSILSILNLSLS